MQVNRFLLTVALVAGLVAGIQAATTGGFIDLTVYRYGGHLATVGHDLYAPRDGLPFTYAPFAALAMAPLSWPPFSVVVGLWTAATFWCLGGVADLVLGNRPTGTVRRWLVAALAVAALALEPVRSNLDFGQVNVFLMYGVAYDVVRHRRRWAGVWIGIAAGLKLTPLLFVFFLLLLPRPRAAITAAASFLATIAIGFAVMPGDSVDYWTKILWDANRVGGVGFSGNQSMLAAMTRILGEQPSTLAWFAMAGSVTLLVMLLAAAYVRSGAPALGLCLAAAGMLIASPISWDHHWVWVFPLLIVLALRVRSWSGRVLLAAWVAPYALGVIWWPPDQNGVGWSLGDHLIGNAYLIALLALCAALALPDRPTRWRRVAA
jgi:alpha-1,2-mannosyltransferase